MTQRSSRGPHATAGANLNDVAAAAGVSVSTASRALSGSTHISPATKAKVLAAARDLNYTINGLAQSISGKGPRPLAYITFQVHTDPQGDIIMGIEQVAQQHNSMLVIKVNATGWQYTNTLVDFFVRQRVLAVIVARSGDDSPAFLESTKQNAEKLRSIGSPIVFCSRPALPGLPNIPTVDFEQTNVIAEAVRALAQLGHQHICFLGDESHVLAKLRVAGFRKGMEHAGLPLDSTLIVPCRSEQMYAEQAASRLLHRPDRPTAIIAYSDYAALGVYRAARTLGLRIPDDLSVIGFNDIAPALDVTPTLSTVQVPFLPLGAQAARMCFAKNVLNRTDLHVTFASKLVLRDSVGPAPDVPNR